MFSLEKWIHQISGSILNRDSVARTDLEQYQFLRLRQTIQYAFEKSSFYRELYGHAGISPSDLHSLSDLSRFPFTEPRHLSESPYRLLCVSQAEIARPCSFVTSGTTGPQKRVFWTFGDIERIIDFMAAGIATVADTKDVVQIFLADGRPYSQADLLSRAVARYGATPVLAGMHLDVAEQFRILRESHSTILFGYTSQLFRLSKELHVKTDLSKAGVKVLFLAGEYLPQVMRQQLQHIWNCRVHTHYGLTEMGLGVAVECDAHSGYHFNEAGLLLEVIDPRTGEIAPPGEEGELVFTTLMHEAMPLIRYRTHDISRVIPGPCACGAASLLKFDSVRKRLESIVTLDNGGEICPSTLDDALFAIPGLVDYRAALTRFEGKERLEVRSEMIEPDPNTLREIHRKLLSIPAIEHSIRAGCMTDPLVLLTDQESLQSTSRAKRLIAAGSSA